MQTPQFTQKLSPFATADLARAVVTARVWNDPDYLDRLRADPCRELASAGFEPGPGMRITVLVDTPTCTHVVLPEGQASVTDGLFEISPKASATHEVRLVRQSPNHLYLVVPVAPEEASARVETEFALASPATAGWSVWTYVALLEYASVVTTVLGAAEAMVVIMLA